jgi:hypothetical protein
MEDKYDRL